MHIVTFICRGAFKDGAREFVPGVLYSLPWKKALELQRMHPKAVEIQENSIGPVRRDKMLHGWRV